MSVSPMDTLTLFSYAKINLTLDVFNKRADGYHGIASVMQTVSLADTLTFTRQLKPGVTLSCPETSVGGVPVDESNLAVRAAKAAIEAAANNEFTGEGGIHINLVKHIPAQAGLGGGSSNAAAALVGANRLLGLGLEMSSLQELARNLGSDVPFFLNGGTAVARGRGEQITSLPDGPAFWLVIVRPEEGVSTAWAYQALDAIPERASHRATKRMEEYLRSDDHERVLAGQSNDFELPVFGQLPRLAWLHDELLMAGALSAHLCGSGSACYGIAQSQSAAVQIASRFHSRYPHVEVACTVPAAQNHLGISGNSIRSDADN